MIIKRDFNYTPKGQNRPLHIYLPDDYFSSGEHYPVMYFFDGHNLFSDEDATYGKSWGMKAFLDTWGKKMIVVGIECTHEGIERLFEYLPYDCVFSREKDANAMGEKTMRWIVDEIKPMIDREYRTYPFRECTAIGGSSMGGLMAYYAVLRHNRWFSKAACVSSAFGFCMDEVRADLDACCVDPDTRVYLSFGTREAHGVKNVMENDTESITYHRNREAADKIQRDCAREKLVCQVGGGHCEADWEKLVPDFMNFLWLEN